MFDFESHSGDKDLSDDRIIQLDNNKLHVRRTDPYGFWSISFDRGQVPEKLKGAYTTFDQAQKAVEIYLKEKNREVKSVSK